MSILIALLIGAALVCSDVRGGEILIPDIAPSVDVGAKPIWVSEQAAVTETGDLRTELFEPHLIERWLTMSGSPDASGCTMSVGGPVLHQAIDANSVDSLIRSSSRVQFGEVIGQKKGFLIGTPGTLYAVRVVDAVANGFTPPVTYFFLPVARIHLRNGTVCAEPLEGGVIPTVGDTILTFNHFPAVDRDGTIFQVNPALQLVVERDGKVRGPKAVTQLAPNGAPKLSSVMTLVREKRERAAARMQ